MASGDSVQLIKDRLNIIDVISPYAELHKSGRHFVARCPFHSEKSPSFHVSAERGTFHCFGCGVGGDMFTFIQMIDGVDFKESLRVLAEKANVELTPVNPAVRDERDQLYAVLEAATAFFEQSLLHNVEASAYLKRRGVTEETIKKWRIGYAPGPPTGGWREVKTHLMALGFSEALLRKAGLVKQPDAGKDSFDVFRDRVMFPLFDQSGRVVAFSGRILTPDEKAPKYVNSPETELYHKSELLYGYDKAKHHLRQLPFWLIVEGQFDVVMSHQVGYQNTVAVSGTALTLHHIQLLERLSNKVVLALDADKAGIAAMKKAADLMLRRGMDVKVAVLPDGKDPADIALLDIKLFKQAVGGAVPVIEFFLAWLRTQVPEERAYKLRVRDEVVPFVTLIPNHIDQDHFEGVIATAISTTKEAVHFEVERLRESAATRSTDAVTETPTPPPVSPAEGGQKNHSALVSLLAACEVSEEKVRKLIEAELSVITGSDLATLKASVPEADLARATFTLEAQLAGESKRGWFDELTHTLNLFRATTLKTALKEARNKLGDVAGTPEETVILSQILTLQRQLQAAPYSLSFFN
jgi:DNA primase